MSGKELEKHDEEDIYGISDLTPTQQRFIHLYLAGRYQNAELAKLLGIHVNTIYGWLRRSDIKSIITKFQEDEHEVVEQNLKSLRNKAIETMSNLMDSPIDGIKYQASRDILDRTGHKSVQKMEVTKEIITYEKQMKELVGETISQEDLIQLMEGDYTIEDISED